MDPTTNGRFRVHNRRPRPDIDGKDEAAVDASTPGVADAADDASAPSVTDAADDASAPSVTDATAVESGPPEEFVLVELPDGSVDPSDPEAADRYDPLYVAGEGYEGDLAAAVNALEPGFVVDATLAWTGKTARFREVDVVRETRFRFADDVEGMFEAAVETWRQIRAAGEAVGSITTRSNDGDPNGALYLFADAPGGDAFAELRDGRLPVEPLVARVNESRDDDGPREVFVLCPADHDFVAVYVVFERDGVLARTVRDTYGLGEGLAAGLDERSPTGDADVPDGTGSGDDFDPLDRV